MFWSVWRNLTFSPDSSEDGKTGLCQNNQRSDKKKCSSHLIQKTLFSHFDQIPFLVFDLKNLQQKTKTNCRVVVCELTPQKNKKKRKIKNTHLFVKSTQKKQANCSKIVDTFCFFAFWGFCWFCFFCFSSNQKKKTMMTFFFFGLMMSVGSSQFPAKFLIKFLVNCFPVPF